MIFGDVVDASGGRLGLRGGSTQDNEILIVSTPVPWMRDQRCIWATIDDATRNKVKASMKRSGQPINRFQIRKVSALYELDAVPYNGQP